MGGSGPAFAKVAKAAVFKNGNRKGNNKIKKNGGNYLHWIICLHAADAFEVPVEMLDR